MTESRMMASPFTHVRLVTSEHLTERRQHSRSPSRAKRRAARGHPQHFVTAPSRTGYILPDGTMVLHPATADAIAASPQPR